MERVSLFVAILLSVILPGAGLLLVKRGGWFALYIVIAILGVITIPLFGFGALILALVCPISVIHTVVAVFKHNGLVSTT